MVSKRSKTTAKQSRPALAVALPHELVVHIVGLVAASSTQPIADLASLRATCKVMHAASKQRYVGRLVALEKEGVMKWLENERYQAVIKNLAGAGNPEACFLAGLTLVFGKQQPEGGLVLLEQAAVAGHKTAAYVLGLLLYTADGMRDVAERYICQVEGDDARYESETKERINQECKRCRRHAAAAVQDVAWKKMSGPVGRVPVMPEGGHQCTSKSCGLPPEGWAEYDVFCCDECRIRNEYAEFFTQVSNYFLRCRDKNHDFFCRICSLHITG